MQTFKRAAMTLMAWALTAATAAAADAGKEIALIVKTSNSNFWQNVQKGAQSALAGAPAYRLTFQGPASESAIADQVGMVENAVHRKVAAIVLAPSDPDALVPAIRKAWEAHIPVVIIDSAIAGSGKQYYQSYIATDNRAAGEQSARTLIERIGTTGKIAVMSYVAGSGSEAGRVGGFKRYIEQHSQLQIVGTYYSQSLMATALNQTIDVLAAHPDLKGIFGANEPTAVGMGRALAQSGRAGKVVGVGFDGNQDLRNFVQAGTLHATAVQDSYSMGSQGIAAAVNVIQGKKVAPLVNTGVVMVTRQNVDTQEAKNVLY
ncbi:LacI family transcriptional regulator [Duganella rhizosphaerae]|uniref:ABC transporter substrate-binding protein n=1 Tax=Duganella rhizosphaerae TaxID=2885763 RepID=UPI0030E9DCF7